MPGVLALLLVIVVVFLIFFSENLQKKKMEEQLHTIIGNQKVLYGSMANKDGTIKLTIQLKFEEILSHKLHFVLFIEGPDHSVYEIKAGNNTQAYNVLVNQIKKVVPQ